MEVQPAAKKASAKKKKQVPAPGQGESVGDANGPQPAQPAQPKPKDPKPKKAKKELTELQKNETTSKTMLAQLQRSQQIMSKVSGHGDQIPSEWKWALPFLQEYDAPLTSFTESLAPRDGDDIKDFVDEMKLSTLDKTKTKQFKNTYKDRYSTLLALFVDRCSSLAAQKLPSMKLDIFFPCASFCNLPCSAKGVEKGDLFVPKKGPKKREKGRPLKIPNQAENYYPAVSVVFIVTVLLSVPPGYYWLLRMDALADKVHSMAQASAGGFTGAPKKRPRKA